MHELIRDTRVKVNVTYDGVAGRPVPLWVQWRGKAYRVRKVGKVWTERRGIAKVWCYGVNVGSLDMLVKVCHSPFWVAVEEISDGLPD